MTTASVGVAGAAEAAVSETTGVSEAGAGLAGDD